jgi:epoxyqueuosine reductase
MTVNTPNSNVYTNLASNIKRWGKALGFAEIGITDTDLSKVEPEHQK